MFSHNFTVFSLLFCSLDDAGIMRTHGLRILPVTDTEEKSLKDCFLRRADATLETLHRVEVTTFFASIFPSLGNEEKSGIIATFSTFSSPIDQVYQMLWLQQSSTLPNRFSLAFFKEAGIMDYCDSKLSSSSVGK